LPPQREGDKLRGTNPVEAGVLKKLKEHLLKILPTIHFLELASYTSSCRRRRRAA